MAATCEARSRVGVLDGARGVAVALVMLYHATNAFPVSGPGAASAFRAIWKTGGCGVDLFFVLSGYLITGILLEARGGAGYYRRFYLARFFRIFPLYYVTLAAVIGLGPILSESFARSSLYHHQGWLWTYTANFAVQEHGWVFKSRTIDLGHFWTLAIEEQFYLAWPAVVALAGRRGIRIIGVGLVLYSIVMRAGGDGSSLALAVGTLTHLDGLAAGAVLATIVRMGDRPTVAVPMAGVLAVTCLVAAELMARDAELMQMGRVFRFTFLAVGFASAIYYVLGASEGFVARRLVGSSPLRMLGKYSYALYVFHPLALSAMYRPFIASGRLSGDWLGMAIYLAIFSVVTLAAARLSYVVLERPCLRTKDLVLQGHQQHPIVRR